MEIKSDDIRRLLRVALGRTPHVLFLLTKDNAPHQHWDNTKFLLANELVEPVPMPEEILGVDWEHYRAIQRGVENNLYTVYRLTDKGIDQALLSRLKG